MSALDDRAAEIRMEQLERELTVREKELERITAEVGGFSEADRLAAERSRRAAATGMDPDADAPGSAEVVDEALRKLEAEERKLAQRLERSGHREMFESFMKRKHELADEEERLSKALHEHEEVLAQIRERLANPPESFLPDDPTKAQLYLSWKKALAEKEEVLRAARRRRHDIMSDLKARHENQIIVLENERREAVGALADAVDEERGKIAEYTKQLSALDDEIADSKAALARFRAEFEQLRVALLVDRMAKSTQVAGLADRRRRLAEEVADFEQAVAEARRRTAEEESRKWEARIEAERKAGQERIAREQAAIEEKINKVKESLAQQYEAGFQPLLQEAEQRHMQELQRVVELQRTLEEKEAELQAAHAGARAAAVKATGAGGEDDESSVPEWTIKEFEELRAGVVSLWEQLDVPPDEVLSFLSECDLLAPYSPQVLELYQSMHKELTGKTTPSAALSTSSPDFGAGRWMGSDPAATSLTAPSFASPIHVSGHSQAGVSRRLDMASQGFGGSSALAYGSSHPALEAGADFEPEPEPEPEPESAPLAAAESGHSSRRGAPGRAVGSEGRRRDGGASTDNGAAPRQLPRSRAALYDTYKADVTSRLYPKAAVSARARQLKAKAMRSSRNDWGSGPGKPTARASSRSAEGPHVR